MKNLILLAAAALSISACGTPGMKLPDITVVKETAVPSGATPISEAAQKALYAAEAAYNIPAQAYVTLNAAGHLPADVKAKAKPVLLQAYHALLLARQAAAAGDTVGVMLQTGEVNRLAAAASAAIPK